MNERSLQRLAALSGAIAVMAGAFGAHGVTGKPAEWLRTGAEYQMVHAVVALAAARLPRGTLPVALLLGGAAVFSGSLYAMALGAPLWFGAITPVGGLGMIAGWLVMTLRR